MLAKFKAWLGRIVKQSNRERNENRGINREYFDRWVAPGWKATSLKSDGYTTSLTLDMDEAFVYWQERR